jgi:hypothetical protein
MKVKFQEGRPGTDMRPLQEWRGAGPNQSCESPSDWLINFSMIPGAIFVRKIGPGRPLFSKVLDFVPYLFSYASWAAAVTTNSLFASNSGMTKISTSRS